jgi:hypothetical protein
MAAFRRADSVYQISVLRIPAFFNMAFSRKTPESPDFSIKSPLKGLTFQGAIQSGISSANDQNRIGNFLRKFSQ